MDLKIIKEKRILILVVAVALAAVMALTLAFSAFFAGGRDKLYI